MSHLRIGIDFGNVLTREGHDEDEKEKGIPVMNMPGCQDALKLLKSQGHYLVLISFCGRNRADSTRRHLPLQDYFDEVYFVKHRDYKAHICKARAIDVLIDDRRDILDTLDTCYGIQFGAKPTFQDKLRGETWKNVLEILKTIQPLALNPDETIDIYRYIYK